MRTQDAGTLVAASDLVTVSDYFSFKGLGAFQRLYLLAGTASEGDDPARMSKGQAKSSPSVA